MNSSSEAGRAWAPMLYPEAAEDSTAAERQEAASTAEASKHEPTLDELVAVRVEELRMAMVEESRAEVEHEVQRARNNVAQAVADFSAQREHYFSAVEQEVVQLALAIARRILHRESQMDVRLLGALVHHELEQLEAGTTVRLCVPPDEAGRWTELSMNMPRPVEVKADRTVAPGCVRMETALGSTVVDFESELKEIERGFFDLLAHRPAAVESTATRVQ